MPDTEAPTMEEVIRKPAQCLTCGRAFEAALYPHPFKPGRYFFEQRHCGPCVQSEQDRLARDAEARRAEQAQRDAQAAWERICPPEFRTQEEGGPTDVERLRSVLPQMEAVLSHPYGPNGLILRGDTGAGKTRAMFRLLRVYFDRVAPRPRIMALTAGQFDRQARDAAGTFTLTPWFDRLASADVVFIDDLGKGRWTPATSGQFWDLVDSRTRHGRPMFITTNFSGGHLVKVLGLDDDTAEPLLRRLREYCRVVVCTKSPTADR